MTIRRVSQQPMPLTFRKADARDWRRVAMLDACCYAEGISVEWLREIIGSQEFSGACYVCFWGDTLVAYSIYVGYLTDEGTLKRVGISRLGVREKYRRRGIGFSMIAPAIAVMEAHRGQEVFSHVREDDLTSQLFFKACGFRCEQVQKDFFADGTTSYRFRRVPNIVGAR